MQANNSFNQLYKNILQMTFLISHYNLPNFKVLSESYKTREIQYLIISLDISKQIEKKFSDVFLLVVGDGPTLKTYIKQASKLNLRNCAFSGFISHTKLPCIYRMGEFMVTPSDTETQGLTVIEAMSQRLPVIGVAKGGVLDYIQNDENGLLVPPSDHEAFAQAIVKLLENPEKLSEYSRKAFETAKKCSSTGFISLLEKAFRLTIKLNETPSITNE